MTVAVVIEQRHGRRRQPAVAHNEKRGEEQVVVDAPSDNVVVIGSQHVRGRRRAASLLLVHGK